MTVIRRIGPSPEEHARVEELRALRAGDLALLVRQDPDAALLAVRYKSLAERVTPGNLLVAFEAIRAEHGRAVFEAAAMNDEVLALVNPKTGIPMVSHMMADLLFGQRLAFEVITAVNIARIPDKNDYSAAAYAAKHFEVAAKLQANIGRKYSQLFRAIPKLHVHLDEIMVAHSGKKSAFTLLTTGLSWEKEYRELGDLRSAEIALYYYRATYTMKEAQPEVARYARKASNELREHLKRH